MKPHYPFTCQENKFWFMENNVQFKEDYLWISENCKKCPKCRWNIEKNEGCNHMTCRLCQHQFCWLCFQDWGKHSQNLCQKLTLENEMQKMKIKNVLKNISLKASLLKSQNEFFKTQKQKEQNFMQIIKDLKKGKDVERLIDDYKKIQEINRFTFLSSKIGFIFSPNKAEEEKIKNNQAKFLQKMENLDKDLAIQKNIHEKSLQCDLNRYVVLVETQLDKLRKEQNLNEFYDEVGNNN